MPRALCLAILLLVAVQTRASEPERLTLQVPRPGEVAPPLDVAGTLELMQGDALPSLKGQVTVLSFFAMWCPGCINELPMLNALHRDFAARGLQVVTVSIDRASERARLDAHLKKAGVRHTVLADPDERLKRVWQGRRTSMPYLVVLDREGVVRHIEEGFDPAKTPALRALLSELIGR